MNETQRPDHDERLKAVFAEDELSNMRLGGLVRAAAVTVITIWVVIDNADLVRSIWYGGLITSFALVGLLIWWLASTRRYRPWMKYVMTLFDAGMFVFILLAPVPFTDDSFPAQFTAARGNFMYAFMLLLGVSSVYSPVYALWTGVVVAGSWAAGNLWMLSWPETITWADVRDSVHDTPSLLAAISQPTYLDLSGMMRDSIIALVGACVIAVSMRRARRMVVRQATAERQRASLARYFSPNLVDELADKDSLVLEERRQAVGVLFADIVGFTAFSEARAPSDVIAALREFHRRIEMPIFEQSGTLDKFIGDGVMATFGTPDPGPKDASNTLSCALALAETIDRWNAERSAAGQPALNAGIGAHYGPCVVGDVGGDQRLEFTVIGDTVNVASRLESATRDLGVRIVISDALAAAVRAEGSDALLAGFSPAGEIELRGRLGGLAIWTLPASTKAQGPS